MGAAAVAPLFLIGEKLGLYLALSDHGPIMREALAAQTGNTERYVREWCAAHAGSGCITKNPAGHEFHLTPEQQAVFSDPNSRACMNGAFHALGSLYIDDPKMTKAFQTGQGLGWGDHSSFLFCRTEKFFRPGYEANLVSEWLPAMEGVVGKLVRTAKIADVGCGHGVSTLVMAKAFPKTEFIGFDFHQKSVDRAQELADESGLQNLRYELARSKTVSGNDDDLVVFFDRLHDMGTRSVRPVIRDRR